MLKSMKNIFKSFFITTLIVNFTSFVPAQVSLEHRRPLFILPGSLHWHLIPISFVSKPVLTLCSRTAPQSFPSSVAAKSP